MTALLSKAAAPFIIAGILFATTAAIVALTVWKVSALTEAAAAGAGAARDSYWTAEIERANAAANRRIAEQAKAALQAEAEANAKIRAAEIELAELEKKNAALPNGDTCGLDRDRVGLLPR